MHWNTNPNVSYDISVSSGSVSSNDTDKNDDINRLKDKDMNTNDRNEMLKQLSALDFVAIDLHMYLDTHPYDKRALTKYNAVIAKAEELRVQYQKLYGPLYSFRSPSAYPWQWIQEPWPVSRDFNFELL